MDFKAFFINKMNWRNVPEETISEAITIMSNMHDSIVESIYSDLSDIYWEKQYLWSYNSDYLFKLLSEDKTVIRPLDSNEESMSKLFSSLRAEIEECLYNGYSVREAVAEWWK
jgi:hypothetical protein